MQHSSTSAPYSREALEALSQVLAVHESLIWMDPATNQLGVKNASGEYLDKQILED